MKIIYQLMMRLAAAALVLILTGCPTAYDDLESQEDMIGSRVAEMEAEDGFLAATPEYASTEPTSENLPRIAESRNASNGKYVKNLGINQGYLEVVVPQGTPEGYYSIWLRYSGPQTGSITVAVNPDPGKDDAEEFPYPGYSSRPVLNSGVPEEDDWAMARPKYVLTYSFKKIKGGDVIRIQDNSGSSIHVDTVYIAIPKDSVIKIEAEDFTPVQGPATNKAAIVDPALGTGKIKMGARFASGGKWVDYGRMYSADADNTNNSDQGYFEYLLPPTFPKGNYKVEFRYACWSASTYEAFQVKKQGEAAYNLPANTYRTRTLITEPYTTEANMPWIFDVKHWMAIFYDYTPSPEIIARPELAGGDTIKFYTNGGRVRIDYLLFTPFTK
jgi:hypothetical protein